MSEAHPRFLAELAGVLLSEETVSGLMDLIVDLAASSIDGVEGASVSVLVSSGPRFETTNASSSLVRDIDEAQYQDIAGPCVQAILSGEEVTTSLPTDRWPRFSEKAFGAGMKSVWSLPLKTGDRATGALNLYSAGDQSWETAAAPAARSLARQGAIVLANAASLASAELANQHLQQALENRDVIGQAKGILMVREGISPDDAFNVLRRTSQHSGRKLRDVAADVVSSLGTAGGQP